MVTDFINLLSASSTKAWLMLSVNENRSFGGNDGYNDQIQSVYLWDSTVPNHSAISVGDVIVLWDKQKLVGIAVMEEIHEDFNTKTRHRCPSCLSTKIKKRKTKFPIYKCCADACGQEFDLCLDEEIDVMTYSGLYHNSFLAAPKLIDASTCRSLCKKPRSIHSMREISKPELLRLLLRLN